jgi:hypothetical protein
MQLELLERCRYPEGIESKNKAIALRFLKYVVLSWSDAAIPKG